MLDKEISSILSEWTNEIDTAISGSKSMCVALFRTNGELVFANDSAAALFKSEPSKSFLNPTFDYLLTLDNSIPLIFEGFVTLGDYSSINSSIWAQIFLKKNKLLIIGGVNAASLLEQNEIMSTLNRSISNIQKDLLREKNALEDALKQLNKANFELKKLNIDKDRFISILGHDLRSPFFGLLGLSEILTEDIRKLNTDEIEDIALNLKTSIRNTFNLLEDILLWARTEQGKIPFEPAELRIADICENVLKTLTPAAKIKNIRIDYSSINDLKIFADSDMLKTIMRNLVSNAIKFTNHNGAINITAKNNSGSVTISVSDNGVGISSQNLSKLFDISEVLKTEGTAKEKGTGLGLLLCKEFIGKHGGEIEVTSEEGKGSVFSFTIPYFEKYKK